MAIVDRPSFLLLASCFSLLASGLALPSLSHRENALGSHCSLVPGACQTKCGCDGRIVAGLTDWLIVGLRRKTCPGEKPFDCELPTVNLALSPPKNEWKAAGLGHYRMS